MGGPKNRSYYERHCPPFSPRQKPVVSCELVQLPGPNPIFSFLSACNKDYFLPGKDGFIAYVYKRLVQSLDGWIQLIPMVQ